MKTISFVLVLVASLVFVLLGCSDNPAPVMAPTDQAAQGPASLEKMNPPTNFTFTSYPIEVPSDPTPFLKLAGRTLHMTNVPVTDLVSSSDPLVAGRMEHLLSLKLDVFTGEGPCHGSWTMTPDAAGGGYWEGTYEGYRSKTADPLVFKLPLKLVGHGRRGTINGMQTFMNAELIVSTAPPVYPLPTGWAATGTGIRKEH